MTNISISRFKDSEKYGFKKGEEIIIPAQFDAAPYKLTNRTIAIMGGYCGIIDITGKVILDFKYNDIQYLFDDLYVVRKNINDKEWSCGVIREDDSVVLDFNYKYIKAIGYYLKCYKVATSEFHSYSTESNRYSYKFEKDGSLYDKSGCFIYSGDAFQVEDSLILVNDNNILKTIDVHGTEVFKQKYEEIHHITSDYFIVKKRIENDWFFGVIDIKENLIIDFKYKFIKAHRGCYLQCFKEAICEQKLFYNIKEQISYNELNGESWLNLNGKTIHEGNAECLDGQLLAVCNKGKWGVIDLTGKRRINFLYDGISKITNNLVVNKDNHVGILGDRGELIINPIYTMIECVNIHKETYSGLYGINKYGCYNKINTFDTDLSFSLDWEGNVNDNLRHSLVFVIYSRIISPKKINFENVFILKTEKYSELFTLEKGILPNSRFEQVSQLTNNFYCVRSSGLYGVYSTETEDLVIPCEYQRLKFEGNHVVLLCKNVKWGAKSLAHPFDPSSELTETNVPTNFIEIKTLDESESLFSVKIEVKNLWHEVHTEYTIVDREGSVVEGLTNMVGFESSFVFYSSKHILTTISGKYGFINLNGYISIPFKYDEIEVRENGDFDVRINQAWGILNLSGKEVVHIKYSEKLPIIFSNTIVCDSESGRFGVLDKDGHERIATIYEHLFYSKNEKILYFGYGGYENDRNFFSNISGATWGCINIDGKLLIEAKYDCFKMEGGFILAGRDGTMLGEGQYGGTYYEKEYGGVYDLYNCDGAHLFGGFTDFKHLEIPQLYMFQFGGTWEKDCEEYDYHTFNFKKGNSRWLILDYNLHTFLMDKNGNTIKFSKGFIGTITSKKENGKNTNYWNMPFEIFSIAEPELSNNIIICGNGRNETAIRVEDRISSMPHKKIQCYAKDKYFFLDDNGKNRGVGMARFSKRKNSDTFEEEVMINPETESCFLLTYPVNGYVFAVSQPKKYKVKLYDLNNITTEPIEAVSSIEESELMDGLTYGSLLIESNANVKGLSSIVVPYLSFFNDAFQKLISSVESQKKFNSESKGRYWFSDGIHLVEKSYNNSNEEEVDYMSDTWDAMTDGMYGDMPEGFDGDFDFLGR